MRLWVVIRYVSITLLLNAGFLVIAGVVSLLYGDAAAFPLFYSALVAALFGLFPLLFIPHRDDVSIKEGLLIVVYSWIACCFVGVLPYVLWGGEFSFTNAWFESVSGYTTTGSSILNDIEAVPPGLLFWRSSTHFLGGIGIIILVLAILPSMRMSGNVLYRSESSPWAIHEFRANARQSIRILFQVYIGLTVLQAAALLTCGIGLFDSVTTAFGTIATGGFSPRQASIAAYESLPVELVVIVFMVLSGMHFGLLFQAVSGNWRGLFKAPAIRFYLAGLLVGCVITAASVHGEIYTSWGDAIRYAAFQVVSLGTSTGFATADSAVWPSLAQLTLIFLTLQCACAGSTSGGIKVDRTVVFLKSTTVRLKEINHPRAVFSVRVGESVINDVTIKLSTGYVILYIGIVFLSAMALTALGVNSLEAFTGSAAAMGNVGPGFGAVGSTGSFASIPILGKWILSITMLLGRLEIFGLVICLTPGLWR